MDPFTIALAVFGVQKLRGQSTGKSFRDALLAATGAQVAGMAGVGEGLGAFQPQAFGSTSLPGMTGNFLQGADIAAQFGTTAAGKGISALYGQSPISSEEAIKTGLEKGTPEYTKALSGTGYSSLSPSEKLITGAVVLPTTMAAFQDTPEPEKAGYTDEEYKKAYGEQRESLKNLRDTAKPTYTAMSPYNYGQGSMYTFNQGGIVNALPKFSVGGVNYMPSKITHDENDVYNYTRASGYVEDGSGTGEKDTDTILAQLADGEFVSRTDAVLGAGIMAGASPNNMKEMRKLGASYFYDQQAKFKRIFDLLDASRKTN
jgi:hypothetical protein